MRDVLSDFFRWFTPWYRHRRDVARRRRRPPDLASIAAIDGMISNEECAFLYELAKTAGDGCLVEIGTYHGKGTVALALGSRAGRRAPVYTMDPFVPYSGPLQRRRFGPRDKTTLLRNLLLAGVTEEVWLIHTRADQAVAGWNRPIALLFVDGDHSYEGVRSDFTLWSPFVVPGGVIAFDDSFDPRFGVRQLIGEVLEAGGHERLDVVGKVTAIRKVAESRQRR